MTCIARGTRRSDETSVCAPYWSLAEERLRKREKVKKGRGMGEILQRKDQYMYVVYIIPKFMQIHVL